MGIVFHWTVSLIWTSVLYLILAQIIEAILTDEYKLKVIYSPSPPQLNQELCMTVTYILPPDRYVTRIILSFIRNETFKGDLYTFENNASKLHPEYQNLFLLSNSKDNINQVCFEKIYSNISEYEFMWLFNIEAIKDSNDIDTPDIKWYRIKPEVTELTEAMTSSSPLEEVTEMTEAMTPSSLSEGDKPVSANVGPIVGGIVGCVVVIGIAILIYFIIRKKKARGHRSEDK